MEFSRQDYWSGLSIPCSGDLPDPGIEPGSSVFLTVWATGKVPVGLILVKMASIFLFKKSFNVVQSVYSQAGTSQVVQWLRLSAPSVEGTGLIPGQGTRSHRSSQVTVKSPQAERKMLQVATKMLCATMKQSNKTKSSHITSVQINEFLPNGLILITSIMINIQDISPVPI